MGELFPTPSPVEISPAGIVFSYVPGVVLVTWKTIVQVFPGPGAAASEPPLKVTEVAVLETVPPHCGVAGAAETFKPAGSESVKDMLVSGETLLFVSVTVTVLMPFNAMIVGEYAFVPVRAGEIAIVFVAGK